MDTWLDRELAKLKVRFPDYDIWYVVRLYGLNTWHARPKGSPAATLSADSPDELAEKIEQAGSMECRAAQGSAR